MDEDDFPSWAMDRAGEICGYKPRSSSRSWWWDWDCMKHFARYIAHHEQPPVDPDLIEAREIGATYCPGNAGAFRDGDHDEQISVKAIVAALKRGRELAEAGK